MYAVHLLIIYRKASTVTHTTTLRRALGIPSLVFFGLVYMVPLTVFTTYGLVTVTTGGRVPVAYIVTLAAMLFTARSYARMAYAYPYAGSAYVYTQRSFGPHTGFLAGWALLLDYLFLPMLNYLVMSVYLSSWFPAVPKWVFIVAAIAVVSLLNVLGIMSVSWASFSIIAVQVIFIVVFVVMGLVSLSGHTVNPAAPFIGDGTTEGVGVIFTGAAILCLSFLGFDAVSTLAEEAKNPTRSVPRAIMLTTVIAGVLFIALSYLSQIFFPSNAFADVDSAPLDVMTAVGGKFFAVFFTAVFLSAAFGSALTSHASVSRILYAMGRDGVLPGRIFGQLSARFATPVAAILSVSILSLAAILISLDLLVEVVSFGALIAFSAVNLSVIKHYAIDRRERTGMAFAHNIVVPLIGFALTVWLWTSLSARSFYVGLGWLVLGVIILTLSTRGFRRPTPMLSLKD
ncbi:MAG: Putrescine importer PuuP [Candidatus Lumbricidophila eiseniae]|uniref:Putrescine importer PuuP n=1 Tax=Candidatus Lumbricidiphila eiseniae TaxID=1969409 RepID=A0A2A6FR71_9MICO|nr:MAG: Putrescine importer PuuP [Candidatus Lumbricidophila eiseniae]